MNSISLFGAIALILSGTALAQSLPEQVETTFTEYESARRAADPATWTGDQHLHWAQRFETLNARLDTTVPEGRRDAVRATLLSLLMPIQDFRMARSVALAALGDQSTCTGRAKWGNFALGVELAEARLANKTPAPDVVLPITQAGLQGCGSLDNLVGDPDAFRFAVVLHHAAACCEPDLRQRANQLLAIEQLSAKVGRADLRADRFSLLVDAAKAYCVLGDVDSAISVCGRAEMGTQIHTAEAALSTVLGDKSIEFKPRLELARSSVAGKPLTVVDVNRLAGLLNEAMAVRDRRNATVSVEIIDLIMTAPPAVLQQVNDQHAAYRLQADGVPAKTIAESRAFECSVLTSRWILHRTVLHDKVAVIQDATNLLAQFPDHPLRDQIERSMTP